MNTGQEEPAALDHEGEPVPSRLRPAGSPLQADSEDEADLAWRALLRAVDMLAGVAGLQEEREDPDPEVVYGLDAYSDTNAYRAWLYDRARVEAGTWVWTASDDEPVSDALGAAWEPDRLGAPGDQSRSPDPMSETAPPTISVIVPVFRPELWYLQQCVESVKRQDYAELGALPVR